MFNFFKKLNNYTYNIMLLLYILISIIFYYFGAWRRDCNIRNKMRAIAISSIGDDIFLVGDAFNMIKCLDILTDEELRLFITKSMEYRI